MRDKRQHCDAISPLNDTYATLSRQFWRQCRIGVALGIWGRYLFPFLHGAQRKASLAEAIASEALFVNWENGTCPYIPTYFPAAFSAALGPATSR